jgi:glycosyltransferase involved in cell wall biosynthesis
LNTFDFMELSYSFIVPVYNRPQEIRELLASFSGLDTNLDYEIVIIEDGSTLPSKFVLEEFRHLNISYYSKTNTGPGDSRNYGMRKARGNYFIVLDSDVLLPAHYLSTVDGELQKDFINCFGGSDTSHPSFSNLQKAINFSMTSFLTTGGIRGKKRAMQKFEPRSFNLGISKEAFESSKGFGKIHPGEDPDLVIRLWKMGYRTRLIANAFVYHKRRISWSKFLKQVSKFGGVRPILNSWHPESRKITFWLPSLFLVGLVFSSIIALFYKSILFFWIYILYALVLFINALWKTKNLIIAFQAVVAAFVQFIGYGYSFLRSTIKLGLTKQPASIIFPEFFFK